MYHYYMFHKPYGCVSARRDDRHPTVIDYFKELDNENLSPVGRLDFETEGLMFITDDGKWNQLMANPSSHKEKVYEFVALGSLDEEKIAQLEAGVYLRGSDKITAPAKAEITGHTTLGEIMPTLHPEIQKHSCHNLPSHPIVTGRLTITEGRRHQVRRMLKAVNCCIIYLKRVSIAGIELDPDLAPGEWKEFFPENI